MRFIFSTTSLLNSTEPRYGEDIGKTLCLVS